MRDSCWSTWSTHTRTHPHTYAPSRTHTHADTHPHAHTHILTHVPSRTHPPQSHTHTHPHAHTHRSTMNAICCDTFRNWHDKQISWLEYTVGYPCSPLQLDTAHCDIIKTSQFWTLNQLYYRYDNRVMLWFYFNPPVMNGYSNFIINTIIESVYIDIDCFFYPSRVLLRRVCFWILCAGYDGRVSI